jgi:small subunit ribosomal protein S1
VVTPGEELWVKIIDLDLQRRRISLSIKQAAEGGVVAAEYQDAFGEHQYDDEGNFIGEVPEDEVGAEGAVEEESSGITSFGGDDDEPITAMDVDTTIEPDVDAVEAAEVDEA